MGASLLSSHGTNEPKLTYSGETKKMFLAQYKIRLADDMFIPIALAHFYLNAWIDVSKAHVRICAGYSAIAIHIVISVDILCTDPFM